MQEIKESGDDIQGPDEVEQSTVLRWDSLNEALRYLLYAMLDHLQRAARNIILYVAQYYSEATVLSFSKAVLPPGFD